MRKTYIGELEEVILLTVAMLYKEEAYGVAITHKLVEVTNREISISAVHATLHRLEEKGFLKIEDRRGHAGAGEDDAKDISN
ncbi:MAG: hypothetical protein WDO14_16660 [Bacteroidota bacterium]